MITRGHLSSEAIDLLMLAALQPEQAKTAHEHLAACAQCNAQWKTLQEDKARFEQFVLPRTLPKIEAALTPVPMTQLLLSRWRMLIPVATLAGVAVVALVVMGEQPTGANPEAYVGIKGAAVPSVSVVAQRPSVGQFSVKAGTTLKPKDRIRFVVEPATANYLLIASQDAAGVFTVYHPFGGNQSVQATPGEVPGSVELDTTVGPETLVAVFSLAPVTAQTVKSALASNPSAPRINNAHVILLNVVKEAQ